jgi:long-chain acyl-CoA synthetase
MSGDENLTINRRFAEAVRKYPALPALSAKVDKEWKSLTYRELDDAVRRFSLGLRALGIAPGDRVAVLSENRPEWAIADLAALAAGATTVPIYPSLPPTQVGYILADSGSKAIIASDTKQLQKAELSRGECPNLSIFVAMEESSAEGDILSYEQVMKAGDSAKLDMTYEEVRDSVKPEDVASFVYTSGTTGDPKAAMLTHGNLASEIAMAEGILPFKKPNDVFLSFLPLSHVFERVTYYLALSMGTDTWYAESLFKVQENMVESHPTVMQSVPRLYESIYERVLDRVAKGPEKAKRIFHWALAVGAKKAERRNAGKVVGPILAIQYRIADKLVLSKIRERFGGKIRFFVSGGAPLSADVARFFHAIDTPILEGYGLTETCAALTLNPYGRTKIGTVGKPLPGLEIKIAGDGEILGRGPTIMKGYWNKPEATAELIDSEGWFHTGDIGEIDKDGYLKITDRKKDIIVLANGKNVAPQPIENKLKVAELVAEVILLGDRSGTVSALIVPNYEKLARWAKKENIAFTDPKELANSAMAKKEIKSEIDALSKDLADFEKIRKIALLDHPLSIENGELTPTLKVRRKIVRERYGHLLE